MQYRGTTHCPNASIAAQRNDEYLSRKINNSNQGIN